MKEDDSDFKKTLIKFSYGFNLLVTTQKRLEGNHEIRVSHAWVTSHDQICSKDAKKTPKCSLVISNQKKEFNSKFSYTAIHYFICLQVLSYFSKTIFFDLNKTKFIMFCICCWNTRYRPVQKLLPILFLFRFYSKTYVWWNFACL